MGDGFTPVTEATLHASLALGTVLLDRGGDPNSRRDNGTTALMLACEEGTLHVADLLIERGADINARS